ncbi:Squalene synthase [Plecturocebus cupreus]
MLNSVPGLAITLSVDCGPRLDFTNIMVPSKYVCVCVVVLLFETEFRSCCPDWRAMVRSRLTATSASQVQDYSHAPPGLANFVFLVETGFRHVNQADLKLLTSGDPSLLGLQVDATTPDLKKIFFKLFMKMRSHCVVQAAFKLLGSSDPCTLASQSAGITGVSHCAWPCQLFQMIPISLPKKPVRKGHETAHYIPLILKGKMRRNLEWLAFLEKSRGLTGVREKNQSDSGTASGFRCEGPDREAREASTSGRLGRGCGPGLGLHVRGGPVPPLGGRFPDLLESMAEKLRWVRDSHGRIRLRHQSHGPLQAHFGAESRRGAQGPGRRHRPAGLLFASCRLALQGLAARRGLQAVEPPAPVPLPLLLLGVSQRRVSCLPAGLAQRQPENLLQVSQSDESQFRSCYPGAGWGNAVSGGAASPAWGSKVFQGPLSDWKLFVDIALSVAASWLWLIQNIALPYSVPVGPVFQRSSNAVCIFYLVLRALDTLEDDMTISVEKKVPLLHNFHSFLYQPDWRFMESKEKDRQVLEDFPTHWESSVSSCGKICSNCSVVKDFQASSQKPADCRMQPPCVTLLILTTLSQGSLGPWEYACPDLVGSRPTPRSGPLEFLTSIPEPCLRLHSLFPKARPSPLGGNVAPLTIPLSLSGGRGLCWGTLWMEPGLEGWYILTNECEVPPSTGESSIQEAVEGSSLRYGDLLSVPCCILEQNSKELRILNSKLNQPDSSEDKFVKAEG